jgi:membrane protein DedA with SNARE-associated domain
MNGVAGLAVAWLGAYTYPVVFVGTLIDASGIPFPGRLLLVAAGAIAGTGRRSVVAVIVLGAIAASLMDHVWYLAGVWSSGRMLRLSRRLARWSGAGSDEARDYFTRYGAATILIGRFFTTARALAWPLAAAHGVGYAKFLALDLVAAAMWASLWVSLGWIVGERWASAAETAGVWLAIAGALVLVVAAAPLATRVWRRRARRRRARSRSEVPTRSA